MEMLGWLLFFVAFTVIAWYAVYTVLTLWERWTGGRKP